MGVYEAFRIQPDLKIPQPVCKIFPNKFTARHYAWHAIAWLDTY